MGWQQTQWLAYFLPGTAAPGLNGSSGFFLEKKILVLLGYVIDSTQLTQRTHESLITLIKHIE